jgi:hypothetical protein
MLNLLETRSELELFLFNNGDVAIIELGSKESALRYCAALFLGAHPNEYYLNLPESSLMSQQLNFKTSIKVRVLWAQQLFLAELSRHFASSGSANECFVLSLIREVESDHELSRPLNFIT